MIISINPDHHRLRHHHQHHHRYHRNVTGSPSTPRPLQKTLLIIIIFKSSFPRRFRWYNGDHRQTKTARSNTQRKFQFQERYRFQVHFKTSGYQLKIRERLVLIKPIQ